MKLRMLIVLLVALPACSRWMHAPGHEQRHHMVRTELPIASVSTDLSGVSYDVITPDGAARVVVDERSIEVAFKTTRATCEHGTKYWLDDPVNAKAKGLRCSITSDTPVPTRQLEVRPGCTSARLTTGSDTVELRSDTIEIAGSTFPGREVSLLDAQGVQVVIDVPGTMLVEYARRGLAVPDEWRVALIAFNVLKQGCSA